MSTQIMRNFTRPVMHSLFSDLFLQDRLTGGLSLRTMMPATNISQNAEGYKIEVAVPGIQKSDIVVDLDKDILTIAFEKQEEKTENEKFLRREFMHESFKRSFTLPEDVNKEMIVASCDKGVLTVKIPFQVKTETPSKKQIAVG